MANKIGMPVAKLDKKTNEVIELELNLQEVVSIFEQCLKYYTGPKRFIQIAKHSKKKRTREKHKCKIMNDVFYRRCSFL